MDLEDEEEVSEDGCFEICQFFFCFLRFNKVYSSMEWFLLFEECWILFLIKCSLSEEKEDYLDGLVGFKG